MNDARLCVAIAARVVDNFGDAGIAWRLARQLRDEHAGDVTLWVDDRSALARFVPAVDPRAGPTNVDGVTVRSLPRAGEAGPEPLDPWPGLVVEVFGCGLPEAWLDAMEAAAHPPVWVNLEYLSAEDWVEATHGLPSPHPLRRLRRWFWFPGFTRRTGGLQRERGLLVKRDAHLLRPDARDLAWTSLFLPPPPPDALTVSLFCYPGGALVGLLRAWAGGGRRVAVLVPEGVGTDAIRALLGHVPPVGTLREAGALSLAIVPFVDQDAFDRRLWSCDFAVVRGEDSFVRAQWAATPFLWHIYPQADDAHRVKLDAFLQRYIRALAPVPGRALVALTRAFNEGDAQATAHHWTSLPDALPGLRAHARAWAAELAEMPDLASQLVDFARSKLYLTVSPDSDYGGPAGPPPRPQEPS